MMTKEDVGSASVWMNSRATVKVSCKSLDDANVELTVNANVEGCDGHVTNKTGKPCEWKAAESSGYTEGMILDDVEKVLTGTKKWIESPK